MTKNGLNISNRVQCEISSIFSRGDREQKCRGERRKRKSASSKNNDWGQAVTVKSRNLNMMEKAMGSYKRGI